MSKKNGIMDEVLAGIAMSQPPKCLGCGKVMEKDDFDDYSYKCCDYKYHKLWGWAQSIESLRNPRSKARGKNVRSRVMEEVYGRIYRLDWPNILREAIDARPMCWKDNNPIREWFNAGNEVCNALCVALRKEFPEMDAWKKIIDNNSKGAKKDE